ncbi:GNAT family N-acetyltransferase [Erysipelothrix rhusiopathiae]|uniref:GNAT family N-acetyltransferase n=1 Tax=Erysipelothrix rhusiopathiae TaxID=1648 RepID=UPI002B24BC3C|nr:GNAT family N-acetyltransferase [Erysipelothrix rhusiopathiae]WRB93144.1 GNAT family N-acetyltransferase [Erysipelothrix rhusiopathiae]
MYEIIQLNECTLEELVKVVNDSFKDYAVKIKLTEQQLKNKLESVKANLTYSFGALYQGELVGFIINATDGSLAYNVMSGVVPDHRRKGVYTQMFDSTITFFSLYGIDTYQLEVLQSNEDAIKLYTRMGFEKTISYACFKGSLIDAVKSPNVETYTGSMSDELSHLWHTDPSFSNKHFNVNEHTTYMIEDDVAKAFITVSNAGGIRHFGYHKISELVELINHVSSIHNVLIINNIDIQSQEIIETLIDLGFDLYMKQFQMELHI